MIADQIERDAVQPGGKLGVATKRLIRAGRFGESLLRKVLDVAAVADVLGDESLQSAGMFGYQAAQQLLVRSLGGDIGICVVRFFERSGKTG